MKRINSEAIYYLFCIVIAVIAIVMAISKVGEPLPKRLHPVEVEGKLL